MALTLGTLCAGLPGLAIAGTDQDLIRQITSDSRRAGPGVLFIAVRGTAADGHRFVADAVAAGCPAVIVDDASAVPVAQNVAVVTAPDTRALPALMARRLAGDPDERLVMAGVTGTNGKTTTAFLLQALLGKLQGPCGMLGTIRYDDGTATQPAPLTTPGGPELYPWLGRMVAAGCRSAALEISSHALDQDRVAGLRLDAAVMTNLGRDHLDYHADLADYLRAKSRIMELLRPAGNGRPSGALVLNAADPHFAGLDTAGCRVVRFAAAPTSTSSGVSVDLTVREADLDRDGTRLRLDWRGRELRLYSPLVGRFNVENLTAALATGLALGFGADTCIEALAQIAQVPGRLERIAMPQGGIAVVDYAHTHDALAAVLATCRELTDGRLLAVFGCGGDRDRGKRPLMGAVAARDADRIWITSDNPRSEDPEGICQEIRVGYEAEPVRRASACRIEIDRREAIRDALATAGPDDVVVIAGKGHEDYQLIGSQRLDFDDRVVVRDWIGEQGHGT